MGEAVVISNPELKPYFRFVMKQNGAMLAQRMAFRHSILRLI